MKKIPVYPRRAQDAYVNQKMLYKLRDELVERIDESAQITRAELKAEMGDLRIETVNLRTGLFATKTELKSDIDQIRTDLHEMKSELHQIKASVHRIELLVEEQNNRNKIVLDGLAHIIYRQDNLEAQWIEFKK